jgi:hypothetical protein
MTPETPSKSWPPSTPTEELKETQRRIDRRLREETHPANSTSQPQWTPEDLASRHHNRHELLREARELSAYGKIYEENLRAINAASLSVNRPDTPSEMLKPRAGDDVFR